MASPDPTQVDTGATWTVTSKTITLSGAVTANIDDGEAAWTASANVTSTADTALFKENTKSAKHVIAAGFTTGLATYKSFASKDLSGYQQVSFWIYNTVAIANGSTLSLRLCSDTAGVTTVDTIAVPAIPSTSRWVAITVDKGSALGSAIQSVALYCDADPGAITVQVDDIFACKASSSPDSLTLTSLIGKVHNLYWSASTSYAQNDIRKPTPPNRNGYRYKKQNSGSHTSGSSEPTWPQEIGATVADGSITWVCEGLEDTWFTIQSINGTTVRIDSGTQTQGNAGRGYAGDTETVATYKRETIKLSMATSASTVFHAVQDNGTDAGGQITFSGGWNTTNMSTQTGETWVSGQNGLGYAFGQNGKSNVTFENLNSVAVDRGFNQDANQLILRNCHVVGFTAASSSGGIATSGNTVTTFVGVNTSNTLGNYGINLLGSTSKLTAVTTDSAATSGMQWAGLGVQVKDLVCRNHASTGLTIAAFSPSKISGFIGRNNTFSDVATQYAPVAMYNSVTPLGISAGTTNRDAYIWSFKHGQVANTHLGVTDGGTIASTTAQRHTASGIAWVFNPTSTTRGAIYPLRMKLGVIPVNANAQVTLSIWARRDNTNINGILVVPGGQIAGVPTDVTVACAPSVNTWTQSSNLTFTPTEAGAVEVWFYVYDGVGTTNSFWIDDFVVSQA